MGVAVVERGDTVDRCAVSMVVVGETKSEASSQAEVSIQKVDLSPSAWIVLTMLAIVWEKRR